MKNVRDPHIYWYHLLFQTGTFEIWDVLQGGEQREGGDEEVRMARWRLESRERPKLEDAGGRERLLG